MSRPTRSVLVILAAVLFGACGGGDSSGPSPTLEGNWHGGASGQGITIQTSFSLHESAHVLNGAGSISGSGIVTCTAGIAGAHQGATVNLTFTCPGYAPLGFQGNAMSDLTVIDGTLAGSGLNPINIDFIKQ